jgi:hypothetical protein
VLLSISVPLFSQNKHINFDNTGKIEINPYTKVDTTLLINRNQGIITDTVFTVTLNGLPVLYVNKNNPKTNSFFPFKSVQILKKKDDGTNKPASLFVFDRKGFICFTLVFFFLIISLWIINRKYMKSIQSAFSEINTSFINTRTQLATFEHKVSKIKDHSDDFASIMSKADFLDKKLNDFLREEREIVVEMSNLKEQVHGEVMKLSQERVCDYTGLTQEEIVFLDEKLVDYHFSSRALKTFESTNIITFSDLLGYLVGNSMGNILRFRNIGKKTMREIIATLRKHDLINHVPEDATTNFVLTSKYSDYLNLKK